MMIWKLTNVDVIEFEFHNIVEMDPAFITFVTNKSE